MSEQEYNDREKMVEKVVLLCFDNLLCQCQGKKLGFTDLRVHSYFTVLN